jgi:hypothetical protein
VPPHSVLAPGTALGLLLSRALPSAQAKGIIGAPRGLSKPDGTERRLKGPGCGPVVRSELPGGGLRSLPFGPTRDVSWMRRPGPARARVSSTMLWLEWPGRRGIRTKQIRVCRGLGPGGAAHGCRGRYLAKECVGSNRAGKERLQLPAAKRRQPRRSRTTRQQQERRNPRARPTRRERNARPALPLRSHPEENRFRLTSSFRNGHIDRGVSVLRAGHFGLRAEADCTEARKSATPNCSR